MQAADTVKVQKNGTNTFISISKRIREAFPVEKGDTLILTVENGKVVIEKPKED